MDSSRHNYGALPPVLQPINAPQPPSWRNRSVVVTVALSIICTFSVVYVGANVASSQPGAGREDLVDFVQKCSHWEAQFCRNGTKDDEEDVCNKIYDSVCDAFSLGVDDGVRNATLKVVSEAVENAMERGKGRTQEDKSLAFNRTINAVVTYLEDGKGRDIIDTAMKEGEREVMKTYPEAFVQVLKVLDIVDTSVTVSAVVETMLRVKDICRERVRNMVENSVQGLFKYREKDIVNIAVQSIAGKKGTGKETSLGPGFSDVTSFLRAKA